MTETTQKALASKQNKIELLGDELAETMTHLIREKAFVAKMAVGETNAAWILHVHWPENATGELGMDIQTRPQSNTNHERQPNVA